MGKLMESNRVLSHLSGDYTRICISVCVYDRYACSLYEIPAYLTFYHDRKGLRAGFGSVSRRHGVGYLLNFGIGKGIGAVSA